MTEGAGGGTVCAAALYHGWHEVVDETLNVKFLEASSALLKEKDMEIHAMTDVTTEASEVMPRRFLIPQG